MLGPVSTLTAQSPNLRQLRWVGQDDYLGRDTEDQLWSWRRNSPLALATAAANSLLAELTDDEPAEPNDLNQDKENQGLPRCATQLEHPLPDDHLFGSGSLREKGKGRASLGAEGRVLDRTSRDQESEGSGRRARGKGARRSLFGELTGGEASAPETLDLGPVTRRKSEGARVARADEWGTRPSGSASTRGVAAEASAAAACDDDSGFFESA